MNKFAIRDKRCSHQFWFIYLVFSSKAYFSFRCVSLSSIVVIKGWEVDGFSDPLMIVSGGLASESFELERIGVCSLNYCVVREYG